MKAGFTMKAMSLAVLGLAGLGFGANALAACPAAADIANGGAWTAKNVLGGGAQSIVTPGLNSTSCAVKTSFNAGAGGLAISTVRDDTPSNEVTYRFRYYINADEIGSTNAFSGLQKTQLFTANSQNAFPAAGGSVQVLRVSLIPGGGTGKQVSFVAGTNDSAAGYVSTPALAPLNAGTNVVEGQIIIGAAGTGKVNVWVNNSTSGTPTATINVDNAGWVGIDTAIMGMADSTTSFRAQQSTKGIIFDEFDSRRTTFIGP